MLFVMESIHDPSEQLRELERGEAAPYIAQPRSPWWVSVVFGVWFAAYVAAFSLWNMSTIAFVVVMLALSAVIGGFFGWYSRRYGVLPSIGRGTPPPEIRREHLFYAAGVLVIAALVVLTWWRLGLMVAAAAAFILVTAGMLLYERRYDRAARAVRERLS